MSENNLNVFTNNFFPLLCTTFFICSMSSEDATRNHENDVVAAIIKCVNFAAVKHKDQRRKDKKKTPYINHPIGKRKGGV